MEESYGWICGLPSSSEFKQPDPSGGLSIVRRKERVVNIADEEEVLSAISMTVKFYNKPFDDLTRQFWRRWLRQQNNKEMVLEALRQYPNTGKFCPKPADIYAIMQEITPPKTTFKEQEIVDDCPSDIREAWSYWIPRFWNQDLPFKTKVNEDQAEQYLITVNQEAKRLNQPDSIPDTHKLQEIWA